MANCEAAGPDEPELFSGRGAAFPAGANPMREHERRKATWKAVAQKGHRWRVGFGKLTIKSKDDRSLFLHDPNSLRVASWSIAFPRSIAKPSPKSYLSEFVSVHVADDLGPEKSTFHRAFAVFSRRADWEPSMHKEEICTRIREVGIVPAVRTSSPMMPDSLRRRLPKVESRLSRPP